MPGRDASRSRSTGRTRTTVAPWGCTSSRCARVPQRCRGCAETLDNGAVDVVSKMCEKCDAKQPSFGMPGNKKRRWCRGCAETLDNGAVDLNRLNKKKRAASAAAGGPKQKASKKPSV
eukprot:SAG22_NODE_1969_length_3234_cov_2.212759_2_plen_118_part_00